MTAAGNRRPHSRKTRVTSFLRKARGNIPEPKSECIRGGAERFDRWILALEEAKVKTVNVHLPHPRR